MCTSASYRSLPFAFKNLSQNSFEMTGSVSSRRNSLRTLVITWMSHCGEFKSYSSSETKQHQNLTRLKVSTALGLVHFCT